MKIINLLVFLLVNYVLKRMKCVWVYSNIIEEEGVNKCKNKRLFILWAYLLLAYY